MARFLLTSLAICLSTGIAHALPGIQTSESPAVQCTAAIASAERGHAIPPQLMAAIGRVESGRRDPDTGAMGAWPWTINAEGEGSYFDSKADAIKAVQALQARGIHSIDVGCMQINLMQHPAAFPNLDMAFEPAVNADYAARFLVRLHGQTGDWVKATANYHSGNPWEGDPYAAKVTSVWPEEQRKAGLDLPLVPGARVGPMASALAPFPNRQPSRMLTMASLASGMAASRGMTASASHRPRDDRGRNDATQHVARAGRAAGATGRTIREANLASCDCASPDLAIWNNWADHVEPGTGAGFLQISSDRNGDAEPIAGPDALRRHDEITRDPPPPDRSPNRDANPD